MYTYTFFTFLLYFSLIYVYQLFEIISCVIQTNKILKNAETINVEKKQLITYIVHI